MTDTPYPAGTRVVLTWTGCLELLGETGTATGESEPAGVVRRHRASGLRKPTPFPAQRVQFDCGDVGWCAIRHFRPLSDPDAAPVVERQEETA